MFHQWKGFINTFYGPWTRCQQQLGAVVMVKLSGFVDSWTKTCADTNNTRSADNLGDDNWFLLYLFKFSTSLLSSYCQWQIHPNKGGRDLFQRASTVQSQPEQGPCRAKRRRLTSPFIFLKYSGVGSSSQLGEHRSPAVLSLSLSCVMETDVKLQKLC